MMKCQQRNKRGAKGAYLLGRNCLCLDLGNRLFGNGGLAGLGGGIVAVDLLGRRVGSVVGSFSLSASHWGRSWLSRDSDSNCICICICCRNTRALAGPESGDVSGALSRHFDGLLWVCRESCKVK